MAGPGLGCLHRVLVDKTSLTDLGTAGLSADDFVEEERTVYDFIRHHYEQYGEIPQTTTVEVEAGVNLSNFPDEPLQYWVDRVLRRNQRKEISQKADEIRDLARGDDLDGAQLKIRELHTAIDARDSSRRIYQIHDVSREVLDQHDRRQMATTMSGVPFGLPYLDKVTDGAQGGDSIALVGRPGVGKTYLLLRLALNAWLGGKIPFAVSMEMPPMPLIRRILALKSGVSITKIRLGRLSYFARDRLVQNISEVGEFASDVPFYVIKGSLTSTVEDLIAYVQDLKPNALYVDGAYLLRSRVKTSQRWERVAETAEILKRIADEFLIPAIGSYQFNRKGAGSLGNIAFSDAVGQLASIVIGIDDENEKDSGESGHHELSWKLIQLIKGREGERGLLRVLYDMHHMRIEQMEVLKGYGTGEDDND